MDVKNKRIPIIFRRKYPRDDHHPLPSKKQNSEKQFFHFTL